MGPLLSLSLNNRSPGVRVSMEGRREKRDRCTPPPAEPRCPGPSEDWEQHRGQAGALGEDLWAVADLGPEKACEFEEVE